MSELPENINFPLEETKVLEFWEKIDAFRTSVKQSRNRPGYTFYDGPPFATGKPHYGHLLAGTIKDIVTRYAHQSGHHVERRFGWDCHGLPVEYEIDKTLGIKGPDDVAKMGIAAYNNQCRSIVTRYVKEWEHVVKKLGRWIDFENDYKTMYPSFMESVWWVFSELYNKGLVYRGVKVMPYSSACSTPLSNFEAGQNYKEVTDPAVIVSFPVKDEPGVSFVAWTTTPWTLPSNMALCVNGSATYAKVLEKATKKKFILMEALLSSMFKSEEEYEVLEKVSGASLKDREYEPIFPYFLRMKERGAFRVLCDDYVTSSSGTGIVHQAPYFGEDDYRVCLRAGIITKDMKMICPVDASGCFSEEVTDFVGQYVKEADKNIQRKLKEMGRLIRQGTCVHNYPFCWRSDTPLLYKAVPSWFVRVEEHKERLLENNAKTYWVPEFVKEGRFANWLKEARDWSISRNRYWGTPIPLWVSEDYEEIVCIGSIQKLEELSGIKVTDLHRETVDEITIPSRMGKGVLRRVPEVFDCWFESGSMPYAQSHYPFEGRKDFETNFPADFIAEGIDQTRGWFYTLTVISTLLFNKPPFKNLIVNGIVLAEDGQKMSKRKKNYPDPLDVIVANGADALRLYLINSPVVRADNLRFKEKGVRDVVKDVFLPWFNAARFLLQNLERYEASVRGGEKVRFTDSQPPKTNNLMDRWILSFSQSLIKFVDTEMQAYRLYTVVPMLVRFVDQLTNWYVRMNRKRLRGDGEDALSALETLFFVMHQMCRLFAPFVPFITEFLFQRLKSRLEFPDVFSPELIESVHYLMLPSTQDSLINVEIERRVELMQSVIELGRVVRDRKTLPIKIPLKNMIVLHKDEETVKLVSLMSEYIKEELNIRALECTSDVEKYNVRQRAEPNHKVLGQRLKGDYKKVMEAVRNLSELEIKTYQAEGAITICGHQVVEGDLTLSYAASGDADSQLEAHSDINTGVLVLLDIKPDQSLLDEGVAREVVNRIQKMRKTAKLNPSDPILVQYETKSDYLKSTIFKGNYKIIHDVVQQPIVPSNDQLPSGCGDVIIKEDHKLKSGAFLVTIRSRAGEGKTEVAAGPSVSISCRFVNVTRGSVKGTVLLENPAGSNQITSLEQLSLHVGTIFDIPSPKLYFDSNKKTEVRKCDIDSLNGKTLHV